MRPAPNAVVQYYDTHPINEEQILGALAQRGLDLAHITEEHLKEHDQDHFGGLEANDILIAKAGIQPHHRVLDVCSGMGGPARYLAHRIGCRVVGLDLTESRLRSAERLTAMAKLTPLVSFKLGNALDMPFEDESFDVVIAQEAWCHIPRKENLIAQCTRVLKPGGTMVFTDILRTDRISRPELDRLGQEMTFSDLGSLTRYPSLLLESGNDIVMVEDLGALWAEILVERLAMYRSLKASTARKFGEERHREWDRYYSFFVGMYTEGKLGGGRFVARKR
ncbi:MAG: class I SAM-dependent methyltransferase [Betaproteobacteria bacterium]|nr:class I SAM-dependent methyltransferase [Betaproteobacteria bacterium]